MNKKQDNREKISPNSTEEIETILKELDAEEKDAVVAMERISTAKVASTLYIPPIFKYVECET
jgi:hypothetical protein